MLFEKSLVEKDNLEINYNNEFINLKFLSVNPPNFDFLIDKEKLILSIDCVPPLEKSF